MMRYYGGLSFSRNRCVRYQYLLHNVNKRNNVDEKCLQCLNSQQFAVPLIIEHYCSSYFKRLVLFQFTFSLINTCYYKIHPLIFANASNAKLDHPRMNKELY